MLDDAAKAVADTVGAEISHAEAVDCTFLDSFDWRLFNAGLVLERLAAGGRTTLSLIARDTGAPVLALDRRRIPRFSDDLPEGALRTRLAPLLSVRALMPLARVRGRRNLFAVRDDEGTKVVRGSVEDLNIIRPGARKGEALGLRLYLEPVRGHEKTLADAARRLSKHPLFAERKGSLYDEAMQQLSQTPGGYSSKLHLSILPEMRADEATRMILRTLYDTMTANEDGIIADIDTEFLHDFRVAIRRTRSALAQMKGVLPDRTVNRYKDAFRWLGQVTGPMRDLDVYLLGFSTYRDYLPDGFRDVLDPLKQELVRRRAKELKAVTRTLKSKRYARLKENWAKAIEGLTRNNSAPKAATPVTEVADSRIWKLYKRVIAEGCAIDGASPPEALHKLRKTCKKLRYLMEFFQSLHDEAKVKDRIKAMKALQNDLGDFQDYAVQIETLNALAREMEAAGNAPRETLLAMAVLTEALHAKQVEARDAFAEIFNDFASDDGRAAMKALYKG